MNPFFSFTDPGMIAAFLAGFHDGDGNTAKKGYIAFCQVEKDRGILDFLRSSFGGTISQHRDKNPNAAPCLKWYCPVESSRTYANTIGPYVMKSRKKLELEVLVDGNMTAADRARAIDVIRKDSDDPIDLRKIRSRMPCAYIDAWIAGFFMADGHPSFDGSKPLIVSPFAATTQKERAVLDLIQAHMGTNVSITPNGASWKLQYYGDNARRFLAHVEPLLPIGSGKRRVCEILRKSTPTTYARDRTTIAELTGNRPLAESKHATADGYVKREVKASGNVFWRFLMPSIGEDKSFRSREDAEAYRFGVVNAYRKRLADAKGIAFVPFELVVHVEETHPSGLSWEKLARIFEEHGDARVATRDLTRLFFPASLGEDALGRIKSFVGSGALAKIGILVNGAAAAHAASKILPFVHPGPKRIALELAASATRETVAEIMEKLGGKKPKLVGEKRKIS